MRTPNYKLNGPVSLPGEAPLVAGDYVKPLDIGYVLKHVLDDERWKWFNKDREVFCYTRKGVVPVPKDRIVEA